MGFFDFLTPGKKNTTSTSSTSTTTQMQDNRVVADGSTVLQAGAHLVANTDASDRSTSHITVNNADAARVAEFNAGLLRDVSANQTDAVKTIAGFGRDSIERMGASVTDLYATAGSNTTRAWEHTLEESRGLLTGLAEAASKNSAAAQSLGQAAIASFQPAENKTADATKYAAMAGAAVVAFMILKGR